MQRCTVVLPSKDIDDPSAVLGLLMQIVFGCIAVFNYAVYAGKANERAAPESMRALNHFSVCIVTVRQSCTSSMV